MDNERRGTAAPSETPGTSVASPAGQDVQAAWRHVVRRRSFLQAGVGLGVATAALPTSALLAPTAAAATKNRTSNQLSRGDAAILRFLATVETLETDLWAQYNELGGNNPISPKEKKSPSRMIFFDTAGAAPGYVAALSNLDGDMPQYISDNADDELSHMLFLNAYLESKGAAPSPVTLTDPNFATQKPSQVTGLPNELKSTNRLIDLQHLNVDTSYYTRYRSNENPDFGATFVGPVTITGEPGIPPTDADDANPGSTPNMGTKAQMRSQAIANTAAFHFGFIEQGGASLYSIMALKASSLEVLRIIVSIGGVETDHFSLWHDKLGGALAPPLNVTDDGLTFPNFAGNTDPLKQINLILPEPCDFISKSLPECSVIRPTRDDLGGAVATINAFAADGLFGSKTLGTFNQNLFNTLIGLAEEADQAQREV